MIISFLQCKHYEYEHKDMQLVTDSWYKIKVYAWEEQILGKFPKANFAFYKPPNLSVYEPVLL